MTPPQADALPASPPARPARRLPLRPLLLGAAGAAAGAAYAHFIGCRTGTCPLTSNVWVAALYGGGVGAVIGWPARRG